MGGFAGAGTKEYEVFSTVFCLSLPLSLYFYMRVLSCVSIMLMGLSCAAFKKYFVDRCKPRHHRDDASSV